MLRQNITPNPQKLARRGSHAIDLQASKSTTSVKSTGSAKKASIAPHIHVQTEDGDSFTIEERYFAGH
jgi:hypothetical protein